MLPQWEAPRFTTDDNANPTFGILRMIHHRCVGDPVHSGNNLERWVHFFYRWRRQFGNCQSRAFQTALTPADGHRDVPDIALSASPEHDPYLVCDANKVRLKLRRLDLRECDSCWRNFGRSAGLCRNDYVDQSGDGKFWRAGKHQSHALSAWRECHLRTLRLSTILRLATTSKPARVDRPAAPVPTRMRRWQKTIRDCQSICDCF